MSEFKEVWHPASVDEGSFVIEMAIFTAKGMVAYTLGQKRRRVGCGVCKDSRFKGLIYCGGYFEYRKCPKCNGTGKVWEYAE